MIFVRKNSKYSYHVTFIFVISGSLLTILYQLQILAGGTKFKHPLIQTTIMFIGELLCLIYYWIFCKLKGYRKYRLQVQEENKPKLKWNQLILPAILDLLSTILLDRNFNYFLQTPVQQTMSSWLILFSLIWTRILLKTILEFSTKTFHIVASIIVLFGSLFANTLQFWKDLDNIGWLYFMIAMIFIIIAQFIAAYQFVYQEKLLLKYSIHPFKFVGIQGLIGTVIMIPILIMAQFTPCPKFIYYCRYEENYYIEHIQSFFSSLNDKPILIFLVILKILIMSIYNICLISILLTISAIFMYKISIYRSIMVVNRSIIVYIVGIIIAISNDPYSRNWEIIKLCDILLHIIGFGIVILGELMYFGKIQLGFNKIELEDPEKSEKKTYYTSMLQLPIK